MSGSAAEWSSMADEYEKVATAFTIPVAQAALALPLLPTDKPLKILEVACGSGALTGLLAERFAGSGTQIVATDFAEGMVKFMQKKASENGWKNVTGQVMDATKLNVPDNSLDAVFCIFGIMLMPEGSKALGEMHRVLHRNGIACYTTWGEKDFDPIIQEGIRRSKQQVQYDQPPSVTRTPGWSDLDFCIGELEKTGFSKVEGQKYRGTWVVNDLDKFLGPLVRNPGMKGSVLKDFTPEELEQFQALLKQLFQEKYGVKDIYEFNVVANIVFGQK
ncbi:uncharacterized protein SPPG_02650 [Spizellomyces punctatus DAOM BR117]|uniref:Methyltransferase domain-containing protein n=1 Tax=Spizellomyces punctatus (strain DAOM BR117) TaxID=645134 RepID=A0A0L0HM75_SPIPD|nr:uncharacterized protein SPPG_02650 [Spizellomyces punctatus DAOM BR117]KND02158.1 hypothetical protein SPPG_02650 [Spizellomyces punctatus DAOM BR117]|eukprot:XP_016610197.1 hypothetical protein SPPG_02650 [Spizellomyces punctatus DAOM BR117]